MRPDKCDQTVNGDVHFAKVYVPVHILVILIQPFFHQFHIVVVVFHEAHMPAFPEQFHSAFGIRSYIYLAMYGVPQIISAVDHKSRLLDIL